MKNVFFLLFMLAVSDLFGQTDSLEKATLSNMLTSQKITETNYRRTGNAWIQFISGTKYPDLSLDQAGKVHYVFINEFKGFDKEKLFNRTMEWLAINYGLLPVNMYSDLKDGKIILRNSLTLINNYSCGFTSIISIKDEKIKFEALSLSYEIYYKEDYDSGIPERTLSFSIDKFYPVILKKPSEWSLNISLFKATNELFNTETKNLNDYILSFDNSNTF